MNLWKYRSLDFMNISVYYFVICDDTIFPFLNTNNWISTLVANMHILQTGHSQSALLRDEVTYNYIKYHLILKIAKVL